MNIPDEIWDRMVSDSIDILDAIDRIPAGIYIPEEQRISRMLYNIIHTEDASPKKKQKLNNRQKLMKGRRIMRKLAYDLVCHGAKKIISKKTKRKSKNLPKLPINATLVEN